ncbi:MAG: 30S ribosomal protein S20 [Bacillota bacterium]|nr:MAG: 30S ribosomal protein S20 [Bacillota bacterium]
MANTKSAEKRARAARHARQRNVSVKSSFRTLTKRFDELLDQDPAQAERMLPSVLSALDQAAGRGVIHANTAARRKSRLAARLRARLAEGTTENGGS